MMTRTFELADQEAFAAISGDFNPMHVDPNAARRLLFGRPVLHGIHALLWALDEWCRELDQPVTLEQLRADFQRPIGVNESVQFELRENSPDSTVIQLQANAKVAIRIRLKWSATVETTVPTKVDVSTPPIAACANRSENDLESQSGSLPLHLPEPEFGAHFPYALKALPPNQLATLLASTRMVGMECPGLHSVYSQLTIENSRTGLDVAENASLNYCVKAMDNRFHLAIIEVWAPGITGTVRAFVRPPPRQQLGFDDARSMVAADAFAGRNAWVVGGSRGLGEVAAKLLAAGGAGVTITFHRGIEDAERIVAEIRHGGGDAKMLALDVLNFPDSIGLPEKESSGPTDLLYFATPHIDPGERGAFSAELFGYFCRYYVEGFAALVQALAPHGLKRVFYPSSIYAADPPYNLAEYGAAKAAGEVVCKALEKGLSEVVIYRPRLPRMATDQTASLSQLESADPETLILEELIRNG